MRSCLIERFTKARLNVVEGSYQVADLLQADEIFLSNAFYGIRWVKRFGERQYQCHQSAQFFEQFVKRLFC